MPTSKLTELKNFLRDQKLDFFILPNSDEFFSEYLPESEKRLQFVTGFSGSNATVIFGQNKSYFFTDGRYTLQAKNELDEKEYEVFNIAQKPVLAWLKENLTAGKKLALDPKLMNVNFISLLQKNPGELVFLDRNPVDQIWLDRPGQSNSKVFYHDLKFSGKDSKEKRAQVIKGCEADAIIITKPENLCWLLNIRASDVEYTPLLLAYAILYKTGEVDLFADEKRFTNVPLEQVNIVQPNCFDLRLGVLKRSIKKIQIDLASTNYWLHNLLSQNGFEIISKTDPVEILKSIKNEIKIEGAIKAHEIDGLAVTKFLFWLEKSLKNGEEIDELRAEEKLLEFRKESSEFLYPSFRSISGFASNGAIIHYHSSEKTNKKLIGNSLYLIDSGGQYFHGTTDITRVVAVGNPTPEMKENYTLVLKGHIALASAKFPAGTSGAQLDVLARINLWNKNLDYDHGTGHGVGSFLSVHEGPCAISKRGHCELHPGMVLSNEPGFYKEGEYGIRIENLMLVEKSDKKFLQFKTLTLTPLDPRLVDFTMLNKDEKKWLSDYHNEILMKFSANLDQEIRDWLKKICTVFSV